MPIPNCGDSERLASDSLASRDTIPPSDSDASGQSGRRSSTSIPQTFGRYQIEKQLGGGGMGDVYLARDTRLDRRVALKIPKLSADEDIDRFYREARAGAGLRHPGICQVFDVDDVDGTPFISMEYIDGEPLSHSIAAGKPVDQRHAARLVMKVASAIAEAHSRNVIHRDLKPSNIMIDERGDPVVMDFGLARCIGDSSQSTLSGTVMGTVEYMPPEQANGEIDRIGPHSDIYSLGATLYHLLTGQTPFQGSTASVLAQVLRDEPRKPSQVRSEVDRPLETICQKMMAKPIEQRFGSMQDVARALADYLKTPSSPRTTETKRPDQRRTSSGKSKSPSRRDRQSASGEHASKLEDKRKEVRELTKRGQYSAAVQILEQMSGLKKPKLAKYAEWARQELPRVKTELEKIRGGRGRSLQTARDLIEKHDYEQAAQLLQQIPESLRTNDIKSVLEQTIDLSDEVSFLIRDMEEAMASRELEGLQANVERLLKLKPGHRRAREVLQQLIGKKKSLFGKPSSEQKKDKPARLNEDRWWLRWIVGAAAVSAIGYSTMHIVMQLYLSEQDNDSDIVLEGEDPRTGSSISGGNFSSDPSSNADALEHYDRGGQLYRQGNVDEAIVETREALRLDPDLAPALTNLTGFLLQKKLFDEALQRSEAFARRNPDNQVAMFNLGRSREAKGMWDEAIEAYRKRIELRPELSGARQNLANALNGLAWKLAVDPDPTARDPKRSVQLADEAVKIQPIRNNWNTLGVAQYRTGDWQTALTSLGKSMELAKGGDSADWFFVAMSHWQLGGKAEARKWQQQAVDWMAKNQPDNEELIRFRDEAGKLITQN